MIQNMTDSCTDCENVQLKIYKMPIYKRVQINWVSSLLLDVRKFVQRRFLFTRIIHHVTEKFWILRKGWNADSSGIASPLISSLGRINTNWDRIARMLECRGRMIADSHDHIVKISEILTGYCS